jgi:hypothetical protein
MAVVEVGCDDGTADVGTVLVAVKAGRRRRGHRRSR